MIKSPPPISSNIYSFFHLCTDSQLYLSLSLYFFAYPDPDEFYFEKYVVTHLMNISYILSSMSRDCEELTLSLNSDLRTVDLDPSYVSIRELFVDNEEVKEVSDPNLLSESTLTYCFWGDTLVFSKDVDASSSITAYVMVKRSDIVSYGDDFDLRPLEENFVRSYAEYSRLFELFMTRLFVDNSDSEDGYLYQYSLYNNIATETNIETFKDLGTSNDLLDYVDHLFADMINSLKIINDGIRYPQ